MRHLSQVRSLHNIFKKLVTVCGTQLCQNDEVCVAPLSGASLCVKRLSDRRYCVDNPCSTGMKCFDNVTSKAYTCYMKLGNMIKHNKINQE